MANSGASRQCGKLGPATEWKRPALQAQRTRGGSCFASPGVQFCQPLTDESISSPVV